MGTENRDITVCKINHNNNNDRYNKFTYNIGMANTNVFEYTTVLKKKVMLFLVLKI